jgi:Flp pilus assembly protein TadD
MLRHQARLSAVGLLLASLTALSGCSSLSPAKIPFVTTNGEIDAQIAMARVAEQSNDFTRSKEIYEGVLAKRPKHATAFHRLGVIAAREERPDKADEYFAKARELAPHDPEVLADIGYQHYLQRRLPEAEEALRAAIEADPKHQRSLNNLGLVLGHQGRFDEALALFQRGGTDAEAHANLAFVLAYHGRFEDAKRNYSIALTKNPGLKVAAEALVELNRVVPDMKPSMNPGMIAGMPGAPSMPGVPPLPPGAVAVTRSSQQVNHSQSMGPGGPAAGIHAQQVPYNQSLGAPATPMVTHPTGPMTDSTPANAATPAAAIMPAGAPATIAPYPMTTPMAPEMVPMTSPNGVAAPVNVTPLPPVTAG